MIDSNGCTVNASTQSLTVTVNNPPSVTLTSDAPEEYYCEAGTVQFTATSPDVVSSYEWFVDGAPYINNNPTFSLALTGTQTVTVQITNASGCTATDSLKLVELSVLDDGVIEFSNPLDANVCSGNTPLGSIVGDGSGTSSPSSVSNGVPGYQWQLSYTGLPGSYVDIDGANLANYTPGTVSTTTYFRRNTIVSPGPTQCEVEGSDVVVINARPEFNINLSTTEPSNCQEETIVVSANTGAATYTFSINGTTIQSSPTAQLIVVTKSARDLSASPPEVQNGDNIRVEVEDNFGCVTDQTIALIIDEVGLNPGVSTNAPGNIICFGENIEIEATGGASYTFFINNTGNPALPAEVVEINSRQTG